MTIRLLKDDETFSATQKINGRKVTATWSVRADAKSPRYALTTEFDFSACSNDEILELAMKAVIIETQRRWRELAAVKGSTATKTNPVAKVNVKTAVVDTVRRAKTDAEKAAGILAKLSDKERAAILATFAKKNAA